MVISKVLIVDDNEADHFLAKMVIEDYDPKIQISYAFDGKEALALLNDELIGYPDIIFLDINMPGMNGIEFLEQYSHHPKKASVIVMLTTSTQDQDKHDCMSFDFVKDFYTKPLEKLDLINLSQNI